MKCPNCGEIMSWREPACPKCGAANPQAAPRKRKPAPDPRLLLIPAAIVLLILVIIFFPKGEAKDPAPQQTQPVTQTEPSEPTPAPQTEPAETRPQEPLPEVIPQAYTTYLDFAASEACAQIFRSKAVNSQGVPTDYAVVELRGQTLLLVASFGPDFVDTLIFTDQLALIDAVSPFHGVLYDPQEDALAMEPYRPMGSMEMGTYSGGYHFYAVRPDNSGLELLFSIGLDEGMPLYSTAENTETITLEAWQETVSRLQSLTWEPIALG